MKKIDRKTPDLAAENVAKLAALFPEVVKDGKVDADALRAVIGEEFEAGQEKFGLTWPGKREAVKEALKRTQSTLRPQMGEGESVDWDTTQNLFIEGDNLEVLRTLLDTYRGKVKMIYIDPPYNTGNDFVYNDTFKEDTEEFKERSGEAMKSNPQTSGRYHSDWLSMMYPRLKLAKEYLSEDGVIFVNIDDHEAGHLKNLMNEVFGENNFFAQLVRRAMHTVRNSSKDFNLHADYVFVYAKDKMWFGAKKERYIRQIIDKTENYPLDDNDGRGLYKLDPIYARNYYTPYIHTFKKGLTWQPPEGSFPRYAEETLDEMEVDGRLVFPPNGDIKAKRYLREVQEGQPPNTILSPEDVGFNSDGTKELRETLGKDKVFSQPKPTRLIRYLAALLRDREALVLDFFAGSGTTAHAVMLLNAEDGGNRRYILVQIPEELDINSKDQKAAAEFCLSINKQANIAEISKERIRRAGKKIREEYADKLKERTTPLDTGFKSFALDSSNLPEWDSQTKDLLSALKTQALGIKPDRSSEDVLYEVLLRYGVDIAATPVVKKTIAGKEVFDVGEGHMLVCLEENIDQAVVEAIAKAKPERVVFRDDGFKSDIVKLNAVETLKKVGIKEENVRVL